MVTIIRKLSLKPGKLQVFMEGWADLVKEYRQEPACSSYNVYLDKNNANICFMIGKWDDEQAYRKHLDSEAFGRAYTYSIGFLTKEPELYVCSEVI
jgi:quinol monooxygenase YgiN